MTDALEYKGLGALAAAGMPAGKITDWSFNEMIFVQRARRRTIRKSHLILHEGSAGDEVAIVLAGRVKLSPRARKAARWCWQSVAPGELIGEMAALGGIRRTATAIAVDDVGGRIPRCPRAS